VAGGDPVSALRQAAVDYLAVRRALGYKLRGHDRLLADFVDHLERAGADTVTTAMAVAWATAPAGVSSARWAQRLSVVRGFARHLRCSDPATEVPPADALIGERRRPTARLFTDDEIAALVTAASALQPALRAATYQTLFGLLAVSGLRVGEAIRLDRGDVDIEAGIVTIDDTKFRKHRRLPLHPTTVAALTDYVEIRERVCPFPKSPAFFVSTRGTRLQDVCVHKAFNRIVATAGLDQQPQDARPRVHGFRHSFAVATLAGWYREGADAVTMLPVLSAYLGHADPAYTYWYLQASPELLGLAAERLDRWEQQR